MVTISYSLSFSYDGAEIRFLKEIGRGWKVNIFDRTFLFDKSDTWDTVARDVEQGRTMMGMCSMWLIEEKYRRMDLSTPFSHLCGTFLVPKPVQITHASYIYLPLSSTVWLSVLCILITTGLLYTLMHHYLTDNQRETVFEHLSRAFLDVVNIVTAHGLPKIIQKMPIRLLIMSWVLMSLLLGTAYSTKYTAILSQPMYTKAVDDLNEFLEEGDYDPNCFNDFPINKTLGTSSSLFKSGLFWGEVGDRTGWKNQYLYSGNPLLVKLVDKMIVEKTLEERVEYIPTGRYARYVKILGNNYVTDTETFAPVAHHLRLMKSCIDKPYTVFPFSKNSPYPRYVNRKLGMLMSSGITDHWFNLMSINYGKSYMAGLFDKNHVKQRTEMLSLEVKNVIGAFYLLGIGLTLAFIAFICEIIVYRRNNSKKVKN